jgi:hypothetical protein
MAKVNRAAGSAPSILVNIVFSYCWVVFSVNFIGIYGCAELGTIAAIGSACASAGNECLLMSCAATA